MKNLNKYIEQINVVRNLMKQPAIDPANLTDDDLDSIITRLGSDYSPENLTCDGELTNSQVRQRIKFFDSVVRDLEALGHDVIIDV